MSAAKKKDQKLEKTESPLPPSPQDPDKPVKLTITVPHKMKVLIDEYLSLSYSVDIDDLFRSAVLTQILRENPDLYHRLLKT